MKETYKVALAGVGHVAQYQMAALGDAKGLIFVGAMDIDEAKIETVSNKIPFYLDIDEMISNCEPDVIIVSVPNVDHAKVARKVMDKNVHVLIEKPTTTTLEDFDELIDIAERQNVFCHTAFHASFARDLLWFLEHRAEIESETGELTGFFCGFYDPYYSKKGLDKAAISLQGSWIDSGINALSVIDQLVDKLSVEESRLSKIYDGDLIQLQGAVDFSFTTSGSSKIGYGQIDTNWTLGLNRKQTTLHYGTSHNRIILDHSNQAVKLIGPTAQTKTLFKVSDNRPRLIAHYDGVFSDLVSSLLAGRDNRTKSRRLLELLVSVQAATNERI